MDENLFVMTADVNGKPIPLWQERLEQLYTAGAPFGELLSLVRWLIDDRAIERILGMSEEELFAGIGDPEAHAAEMRAQFDGVARLVHERDALRAALDALVRAPESGLTECESVYLCVYCDAQPDMSAAVVNDRHAAGCPIVAGRAALEGDAGSAPRG